MTQENEQQKNELITWLHTDILRLNVSINEMRAAFALEVVRLTSATATLQTSVAAMTLELGKRIRPCSMLATHLEESRDTKSIVTKIALEIVKYGIVAMVTALLMLWKKG